MILKIRTYRLQAGERDEFVRAMQSDRIATMRTVVLETSLEAVDALGAQL